MWDMPDPDFDGDDLPAGKTTLIELIEDLLRNNGGK
jgi:hypothetical protein